MIAALTLGESFGAGLLAVCTDLLPPRRMPQEPLYARSCGADPPHIKATLDGLFAGPLLAPTIQSEREASRRVELEYDVAVC